MEDQAIRPHFFARLRSFDIECPRCGEVYCINRRSPHLVWSTRMSRFECKRCTLKLALGIVAYPAPWGRAEPPPDITPTVTQALELRRQMDAEWAGFRLKSGDPVNRVGETLENPLWAGKAPTAGGNFKARMSTAHKLPEILPPAAPRPKKG